MERLTYRGERDWEIKGAGGSPCDEVCENRFLSGCHDCPIQTAFDRLAAYEDTGLEPGEVTAIKSALMGREITKITEFNGIPIQRLQELAHAEKDGRLVVLPCKVGDLLYEVDLPKYGVITCKVLHVGTYNGPAAHVEGNPMVSAVSVGVEVVEGQGKGSGYAFEAEDFGKTVFLTREEAEAALKRREEEDHEAD